MKQRFIDNRCMKMGVSGDIHTAGYYQQSVTHEVFIIKSLYLRWVLPAAILAAVWIICGGFMGSTEKVVITDFAMNTSITITVYAKNKKKAEAAIRRAFDEIARIEHVLEPLKGDGDLEKINRAGHGNWWDMNPDIRAVLMKSKFYFDMSGGAFDPTIGPVKWLWDFENGGRVPSGDELDRTLPLVGLGGVEIKGSRFCYSKEGMKLDFGAIAKGYAVDRMADVLRRNGITSALVNAGGNITTIGKKPGNEAWVIGVRHPRNDGTILVEPAPYVSVATSGDYERYFIRDGVRYHHILDPRTGKPAMKCISATAWTSTAMDADALSTTLFVLGPEKGIELARRLGNVEALFFYERNGRIETAMTPGIVGKVRQ